MKLAYILILATVLVLAGCGKSEAPTGEVVKASENSPAPTETSTGEASKEPTQTEEPKPEDKEKVGLEESGLFKAKYCNYKSGVVQLGINNKKNALAVLEKSKEVTDAVKQEIASINSDLLNLEKELANLKATCSQSKFGDACTNFKKDVEASLGSAKAELADDKESLGKWEKKLEDARTANNLMDITIAQAKVDKVKPRVVNDENQVNVFTTMLEDLEAFC